MLNEKGKYAIPAIMASLLIVVGCDNDPQTSVVTVEEDIVLDNGDVVEDWIVEEVVPIPTSKPATVAPIRPSSEHIWIPGEWKREGDKWEWEAGRWRKPPTTNASWMAGHWRMLADKWHWTPGHWVVTSRHHQVSAKLATPEPLAEVMAEKPSDQNHWVAGYWDWDGHWYWVPGYWTSKPHPDAEWVTGHWDEFGLDGGYRWIGGHWRLKG